VIPQRYEIRDRFETLEAEPVRRSVDLMYLVNIARSQMLLILGITLLSVVGMFIYVQNAAPVYSASAQVIMDSRSQGSPPGSAPASDFTINSSVVAGEVQLIRSNVLIGQVVDNLDMMHNPEFSILQKQTGGVLSSIKSLFRSSSPSDGALANSSAGSGEEIVRTKIINAIQNKISVTALGVSYAIGITFTSESPNVAARVTNAIAQQYISDQIEGKKAAAVHANSWLSDRIVEMSKQVEQADGAVVEFRSKMTEDAGGSEDATNKLLQELNTKLVAANAQLADDEVRYQMVVKIYEESGLPAVASFVSSPLLQALQKQLADDLAKQAELSSTLGKKHPQMVSIASQIDDVQRGIDDELRGRMDSMKNEVAVATSAVAALQEQIVKVSDRLNMLSHASIRLDELTRTADATRLVYENFLSRFKETDARSSFQTADARVIGEAQIPTQPSSPRKTLLMLMAGVFGLSLGVAIVFLRNLVISPVSTSEDLRGLTQSPTLAMLPHVTHNNSKGAWLENKVSNHEAQLLLGGIEAFKSKFLVVPRRGAWLEGELSGSAPSPFLEGIRAIRTKLFSVPRSQRPHVLMVTSTLAGEGKSSICFALAHVLKQPDISVVVLDADLRRCDTVETLKLSPKIGCLVDFLEGKRAFKGLVEHSEMLGVDIVVPTRSARNAADLLASQAFSGMVTQLSSRYNVVIINAPPVLDLSDALLLAKFADATIFAVQSGRTPAKAAAQSLARLREAGATVVGTVMTQVRRKDVASGDVYGSYYY
jgi:polysaccharide biosynthesis transport protein